MERSAISSVSNISRRMALGWTLLLILPNLAFFAWLFLSVNPRKIIVAIYGIEDGTPAVYRLPLAFVLFGVACAFLRTKRRAIFERIAKFVFSPLGTTALIGAVSILVSFFLGVSFLLNVVRAAWGAVVLFCAAGIGLRLLECKFIKLGAKCFESPLERLVLGVTLGLGVLSLAVFAAASFGWMNSWLWRLVILGLCAQNFTPTRGLAADLFQAFEKRVNESPPFVLACAVFLALFMFMHAPLIWNLPAEYDVLEYHLGAPAQYLRAGSAGFLRENIYATFPENGEMLYLLSMLLAGEKLAGLPGAHVILLAAWVLTILGVYALARRLERTLTVSHDRTTSPGPAVAAFLFALVPMGSQLAADFYVEHFQTLFHLAALLCGCAFLSDFKIQLLFKSLALNNAPGWLVCAGLFAGLCCGAKYTGLIFTLLPLTIFLPGYCALSGSPRAAATTLCRLVLPALLAFAPWTLRNWIASGDPLHPLGLVMRRRLSGASGIPDRLDHFEAAHRAGEMSWRAFGQSLVQLMPGFRQTYFIDIECGPQLCFFGAPGMISIANAETALVGFVFMLDLVVWFAFSHRLNRFFYPHLTMLAALGGLGFARVWRVVPLRKVGVGLCCVAALLFAPLQAEWTALYSSREGVAGNSSLLDTAKAQFMGEPVLALVGVYPHSALPEKSGVLFIGEAQTFYCERTPSYSVVFNESLLEEALHKTRTADEALNYLRARGITHLYFNFSEWFRLDTTYALKLDGDGTRWRLVHWEEQPNLKPQHDAMKTALRERRFSDYPDTWPAQIVPAYLKLTPEEYNRFDELYRNHTRQLWPDRPAPLELRELF